MAQESCNLDKEEAEILKPSPSSPSPAHKEEAPPSSSSSSPTPPQSSSSSPPPPLLKEFSAKRTEQPKAAAAARLGNRCSSCRRKVGLTGFRCRCGDLFCGQHRYSDTHDCSFDYKALGREQISKANPVVRAAKIIKI